MYRYVVLFLIIALLSAHNAAAQSTTDSTISKENNTENTGTDSLKRKSSNSFITPKKIALYSAILPGLGQYKNKQYWKVPVVYVGIGAAAYFYYDNVTNYNLYRREYANRLNNPNYVSDLPYGLQEIQQRQELYKRWLDMTVMLSAAGYLIQIIDATVFAHMKGFDMSPDITLKFKPTLMPQNAVGIGFVFNLKEKSKAPYGKNFGY